MKEVRLQKVRVIASVSFSLLVMLVSIFFLYSAANARMKGVPAIAIIVFILLILLVVPFLLSDFMKEVRKQSMRGGKFWKLFFEDNGSDEDSRPSKSDYEAGHGIGSQLRYIFKFEDKASVKRRVVVMMLIQYVVLLPIVILSLVFSDIDILWGTSLLLVAAGILFPITFWVAVKGTCTYYYRKFLCHSLDLVCEFDERPLARFKDVLESISIGYGIDPPEVAVLDSEVPNSVTFLMEGEPTIGITRGLLEADVSYDEIEAVMAHELSHVMLDDYYKPFSVWQSPNTFLYLVGFFCLTSLMAVGILLAMSGVEGLAMDFFVLAGGTLFLAALFALSRYFMKRLVLTQHYSDIVADSVASKITYNPSALKSVLEKLFNSIKSSRLRDPKLENAAISRNLFIDSLPRDWVGVDTDHLVSERLNNLSAVEQGHWPAFE
ncbi:MAG: M48 family metalloprotease [Actinobacteria bacterium]|nr:M48 family metalloprotease [Actinomycetota bacterium]MBU4402911.1 M48 family metalloprotease [Actinomycetota bacterium]MBU4442795.1 M48 family metalloprotease [Actinomycetota bacterium]